MRGGGGWCGSESNAPDRSAARRAHAMRAAQALPRYPPAAEDTRQSGRLSGVLALVLAAPRRRYKRQTRADRREVNRRWRGKDCLVLLLSGRTTAQRC